MHPLRRHQLALLSTDGWNQVLANDRDTHWDDEARYGLAHWAAQGLPLVVARQRLPRLDPCEPLTLGVCLPAQWNRRRLSLQVPWRHIALFSEFPLLTAVLTELPRSARGALRTCAAQLHRRGLRARVYGSAGWQCVTGLPYLHARSDIDLWVGVDSPAEADAAADVLACCTPPRLRMDGELVFTDGAAVAWREWQRWRAGGCSSLLLKRLDGVDLLQRPKGRPGPTGDTLASPAPGARTVTS